MGFDKTENEYLEQEKNSETKHEYFQGETFAMAGASETHNLIVTNVIIELGTQLKKTPCRVYPGDMRLKIEATGLYTYPDVMIICEKTKFDDDLSDTVSNPEVIIEVLSDSTEGYGQGKKFASYRKLNSLKEYIMISQNERKIERYFKNNSGFWLLTESDEDSPQIILEAISCELNHSEVYNKIS